MKKRLLLMLFALPLMAGAVTLPDSASTATGSNTNSNKTIPNYTNALSLQLEAGTQGVGGDLRFGLSQRLSARLGANFAPINTSNNLSFSGFTTDYTADVKFSNVHLLLDLVPFKRIRGFRLVTGAAYLYQASGAVTLSPTGNYTFGNYKVTGADIGTLNMQVDWKGVAPYFGLGLFRGFPSHFFNFNLDLGTYYLTSPKTHIVGTNLLADNNSLEPQFNENLKDYRWMPVLQLNFNFRIK